MDVRLLYTYFHRAFNNLGNTNFILSLSWQKKKYIFREIIGFCFVLFCFFFFFFSVLFASFVVLLLYNLVRTNLGFEKDVSFDLNERNNSQSVTRSGG